VAIKIESIISSNSLGPLLSGWKAGNVWLSKERYLTMVHKSTSTPASLELKISDGYHRNMRLEVTAVTLYHFVATTKLRTYFLPALQTVLRNQSANIFRQKICLNVWNVWKILCTAISGKVLVFSQSEMNMRHCLTAVLRSLSFFLSSFKLFSFVSLSVWGLSMMLDINNLG